MAGRPGTTQSRKRLRAQNEKDSPSAPSTVPAKKRRVDKTHDREPGLDVASTTPGLISTAINGAISLGRRIVSSGAHVSPTKKKPTKTDAWEVPDSDEEPTAAKPPLRKASSRKPKALPAPPKEASTAVYDVPESGDDELARTLVSHHASRQKTTAGAGVQAKAKANKKASQSAREKPGRTSKASLSETQDVVEPQDEEPAVDTPSKSRSARKGATRIVKELIPESSDDEGQRPPTPLRNKDDSNQLSAPALKIKGILTPAKHESIRRQKSVAFNSGKKSEETFEEAVSKATESVSKPGRGRKQAAPQEQPNTAPTEQPKAVPKDDAPGSEKKEEEDDEVCAICSKPDSKRGNEIVFCDSCDMGYHQKCHGLAVVPKGDWICRNCLQEDTTSLAVGQKPGTVASRQEEKPAIPNFEQHLRTLQRVLLDRCAGRRRIKLRGQDEAYEKASQLVEQTIVAGEGNSMLVIGARGCGKTTLVESIVADMSKDHKDQFHIVRLNGFIHTDDKLALREIWRQLGKEMEVEDELVSKTNNYADTMASLLALLSHPSEIADAHEGVTSKSVIFAIDEFDLFATHARQTLLYNLFDIAQARKAPIAVIGLTTRIDVVESLEKRVKSRFSHRYVYLSLPKSLPAFWDVCRQGLSVDAEDMRAEGIDTKVAGHGEFWKWWNSKLEALRKTRNFEDHLESHFCSTKSVSAFLSTCLLPLSALSPTAPTLRMPGLQMSLEPPDAKLHVLEALSDLDLTMLIAAARLDIVAHTDTVNFAMAYDEYTSLMGRQRVQSAASGMMALGGGARVWGRGIAGMAWERLVTLGMLIPAATVGRGAAGQSGLDAKMWKVDVALEEIPAAIKLNAVLSKWCREI
ncbi:origin recognition complex subunit 4 C-terminus-domain-containing protein [Schizothecium vesticola]|uniref:Origin recognition complex subunit 4 n=1 Tax=Schizothecium vesticola TaxID=314040 RepID=A0AA40F4N3_9PEZI|nr:origin recognition complex subunit 4 C-terminus-domain-containing protein [Schizothecium vesticola]